jgi:uncharacterized protein
MTDEVRLPRIPPAVARKLGFYVYVYVNPVDNTVFYVGKGKNGRALAHLRVDERKAIAKVIRQIRATRKEPQIDILAHNLGTSDAALKVEAAAIDLLGVSNLSNAVRGHGAQYGRLPLREVVAHYTKRKGKIREAAILIRINKQYRYGMTDLELYDATRSAWRLGPKRDDVEYAFSVYEGVVREVYRVTGWLAGGSTFNGRNGGRAALRAGRSEFVGTLAAPDIRKRYINRFVGHLFPPGAQNPVSYVNMPRRPANNRLQATAAGRQCKRRVARRRG